MFRLLRYFSVISLIAFLIVTVLLGLLYRRTAIEGLIAQEESKNVAITQALVNSLRPQLVAYLATAQGVSTDELRTHPALTALQREIEANVTGLPVAKIKIYDLNGITIFSTEVGQIGEDGHTNSGFVVAKGGGVISELTHRDTFSSFEGVVEDQDVLSTYFPVLLNNSRGESPAIEGVFEFYSNVTPFLLRINRTQRTVVIGVALILAVLYVILFLVVRHADTIIRRQRAERIQAEAASREQQRMLAALRERERLARELHDSVAQVLGYLNTQAQSIALLWGRGKTGEAQGQLQRMVEVVQQAQGEVRAQIRTLQSGTHAALDFPTALTHYLAQFQRDCDIAIEVVNLDAWRALPLAALGNAVDVDVETQLLRIIQEALTNMRKHAHATRGWVRLDVTPEQLTITVADNGRGFGTHDRRDPNRHFGLQMMHDRTHEIGGTLSVQSTPGKGTTIQVSLPLRPLAAGQPAGSLAVVTPEMRVQKPVSTYSAHVGA